MTYFALSKMILQIISSLQPRIITALDRALFRRFDDVLNYELPGERERAQLIANLLGTFIDNRFPLNKAATEASG